MAAGACAPAAIVCRLARRNSSCVQMCAGRVPGYSKNVAQTKNPPRAIARLKGERCPAKAGLFCVATPPLARAPLPAPALGWGRRARNAGAFSVRVVSFITFSACALSGYALAPTLRWSLPRFAGRGRSSRAVPAPPARVPHAPIGALATLGESGSALRAFFSRYARISCPTPSSVGVSPLRTTTFHVPAPDLRGT